MHRPNFSMPIPSMHLQVPKEQPFGPPIVVTTPCDESVAMPFESFTSGLAPMVVSPPRTPLPKVADYEADLWKRHSLCSDDDEEMTRPSSAASMYSSSSACSFGSMTSFNSFPASAESPRHEKSNSFSSLSSFGQEEQVDDNSMDIADTQRTPRARRPHRQDSTKDADWSKTFDLHLWGAYIAYQSNPTVTPFYVPPGGCPPIGVCIRVSREAKRTWRVPKTIQETDLTSPTERLSRNNSETLLPVDATIGEGSLRRRRGSRTQVSRRKDVLPRAWPYSETATRQRLRILSRRITENPHLQTRHGRLASPIHMKQFAPPRANIAEESQYSTRSLSFSLVASTSESMQSTGPLARLSQQFESEDAVICMPQGDVPLAHDVFRPTLEPSYEVDDELDTVIPEAIIASGHRRNLSAPSIHRRSGSKSSILHRKTEGSNGIGHRRTTSATGNVKPEITENLATPRKRTRMRSSSDATIRSSIPRMLCLGSPFGTVEEEGEEASRHARRSVHKRHQSLETPLGHRPTPTLMPAFDFTKQEAYQNALKQQEQERLAQPTRPATMMEGKKKDHFFEDLFGTNASRTNLSERSSTPSVSGSDGASIRVPSKKTRARGMSFTDKIRGNPSGEFITPLPLRRISAPPDHLRVERPSVLKRLGSPFRDSEFAPLDSTINQSQVTLPDASTQDLPATAGLGSAFTSPPRTKKRDTGVAPTRERGILGFGLGFFRRGKKDTSQQH
ncbi:hypothetical protein ABW20_dc0104807 [Dactylellina cionopaga]|nr:hypothetical protein ABW20_dc0104807 [Dactylellina cionopaga]